MDDEKRVFKISIIYLMFLAILYLGTKQRDYLVIAFGVGMAPASIIFWVWWNSLSQRTPKTKGDKN